MIPQRLFIISTFTSYSFQSLLTEIFIPSRELFERHGGYCVLRDFRQIQTARKVSHLHDHRVRANAAKTALRTRSAVRSYDQLTFELQLIAPLR